MSVEPLHSRPRCVLCAAELEPGARKCTKCEAMQDVRGCPSCHMPTPAYSARCVYCKALEEPGIPCRVCGTALAKGTIRCETCTAFQNWRRWVPASQVTLALLVSLISVLSAVIPPVYNHFANRSETYVRVIGSEKHLKEGDAEPVHTIVVLVANNGKRPSLVRSARLTFDQKPANAIHVTDTDLEVHEFKDVFVLPNTPLRLHLAGPQLGRLSRKSQLQVMTEVRNGGPVNLTLIVEETDRNGETFEARPSHTFKADLIDDWMEDRVSSQ